MYTVPHERSRPCSLKTQFLPTLHVCLLFHLSTERTIFVCYQFFKQLRTKFGNKPIYIDGSYWYKDACRWLRLKHIVYGTELKNIMERFIQHIKDRTEYFDDNFPCKSHGCDRKQICNWLRCISCIYI